MSEEKNVNYTAILSVIIVLLLVIIGEVFYFSNKGNLVSNKTSIEKKETSSNNVEKNDEKLEITVITDKRCGAKCDVTPVIAQLKQIPSLSKMDIKVLDYSDSNVKEILDKAGVTKLPIVLLSNNETNELKQFTTKNKDDSFSLNIGGTFDPTEEICGNGIDDNNNGKTDCEDSFCAKTLSCAPKVDKPKAELFVMSYCPYGTQAQKGYLSVMKKLGKVADVKVNFVNYLMHGEKEGEQNLREYCIQKEQNDKFANYLECFLKEGDFEGCIKETKIDENKLNTCVENTKKEIKYDENLANKTGRFPKFLLDDSKNLEYGVQGSPTFVLNGIKVDRVGRDAKSYADLICNSFKVKPKECEQDFSDTTYDPNFGFTSNGKVVSGGCGQ